MAAQFAKPAANTGVASRPLPHQATILLVEDEALVREMTSTILESQGYRVLTARDAQEATAIFGRYGRVVRLLLTDVVLPGQSGQDLASSLRKIRPGLRTIFSSGYPENAVTRQGVEKGSSLYLAKPFSAQDLLKKVSQVLQEPP